MAHSDCSLMLEIFTKGTRFFKDCPLDLRMIQAYHPRVPKRCQQLRATASTVLLQMLGRNFKKDCCFYSLLPRRENGTSEKSFGEGPRPVINCRELGCAQKGGDCLLLCLCKASPPLLAFDAESPSQTGWRTGLSVLDLVHPTQLKSRGCFSPVIPEWRTLTACLSAACSRRQ